MATIQYNHPDYFNVDELLTDEHKLIRDSVRDWVNRRVKPIIDEACHKHKFPVHLVKEIGEGGAFGITGDFPMMRHMMKLESIITYEGTHDIHLLITGHDITGEKYLQLK